MIYLDHAATTGVKPEPVRRAVMQALMTLSANPGRSGAGPSLKAAEMVYACRKEAASFFGAPGPECVVFPLNCTQALNMVIKGVLRPGDEAVCTDMEHNAVARPLYTMEQRGVITVKRFCVVPGDDEATLANLRKVLSEKTRLVVAVHASNVFGIRTPVERIGALCRMYRIPFCIDAAQTAGVLPLSMENTGCDYLCAAGHKGLYGPMGTGLLIARDGEKLQTVLEGGTGSSSRLLSHPGEMPEHLESGTLNVPGIAGLLAGMRWVKGQRGLLEREMGLCRQLWDGLHRMPGVKLYLPKPEARFTAPVLSFNVGEKPSEQVAASLSQRGILVRAGLHCAPLAHEKMGTLEKGTVRVSVSAFTRPGDVGALLQVVGKIRREN